jgi:hypothetical protein
MRIIDMLFLLYQFVFTISSILQSLLTTLKLEFKIFRNNKNENLVIRNLSTVNNIRSYFIYEKESYLQQNIFIFCCIEYFNLYKNYARVRPLELTSKIYYRPTVYLIKQ